jgi:hypothetical protein
MKQISLASRVARFLLLVGAIAIAELAAGGKPAAIADGASRQLLTSSL